MLKHLLLEIMPYKPEKIKQKSTIQIGPLRTVFYLCFFKVNSLPCFSEKSTSFPVSDPRFGKFEIIILIRLCSDYVLYSWPVMWPNCYMQILCKWQHEGSYNNNNKIKPVREVWECVGQRS